MASRTTIQGAAFWSRISTFFALPPAYTDPTEEAGSPLCFHDGTAVKTAEDWQGRRREILGDWHGIMGRWPELIREPAVRSLKVEERERFLQHTLEIEAAPGLPQRAYLLVPMKAPASGRFPAVVTVYYEPETAIGLKEPQRDFAYQLTRRGFVTLSIGSPSGSAILPWVPAGSCQPLSYLAYVAANCHTVLARRPEVDGERIGIVGHSYGGKWAMFGSCLYEKFAAAAWSDPGIVFDETRAAINYWDSWYLGSEEGSKYITEFRGLPGTKHPRTGAYKALIEGGHDLTELHALMAPRPFLVSGGEEDPPHRWRALQHSVAVNRLLGFSNRVGMTNRATHTPTKESNEQLCDFFEYFLNPA